ncbi:PLP-dependent aminotransferase family protein [Mesorhizobium sp. M0293]|uniref:aminotransferase-like domain-containing protein n=1 Tax=Mesorhizobium sp. M0293 TaxID=2956930 RepID=UPI0033373728
MNTHHANSPMPETGMIDMTRTMPPFIEELEDHIRHGLAQVAARQDLATLIQRHHFFGSAPERQTAAAWLSRRMDAPISGDRVYMTGGTQNALQILLPRLAGVGGCIATEELSYAGTTQISRLFGMKLVGVPIDDGGIVSEAFREVCERHAPKVLYCNPTIHNPTASVLSEERRKAVAAIAREHGVAIIEDDVHGMIVDNAPRPIAHYAPDITWYLMSVSKCIGMGLRTAFLVGPDHAALTDLCGPVQSLSSWFVPGISSALVMHLVDTGAADRIAGMIRNEVRARQNLATEALKGLSFRTHPNALHLWLNLPDRWTPSALTEAVRHFGVQMRPSDLFNAGGIEMPNSVRLSLVAPATRDDVRYAVRSVAALLQTSAKAR